MAMSAGSPSMLRTSLPILALTWLCAGEAHGQAERTATARQLANQGIDAIEAGDCDRGVELLTQAEDIFHAPVHLSYIADCHEREGRLLMATETWRKMLRDEVTEETPDVVREAIEEAERKLERTLPMLSTAKLVPTKEYAELELALDGKLLDPALIGAPQVMDPGEHELVASAPGYSPKTIRWTIESGESIKVDVVLVRDPSAPLPAAEVDTGESVEDSSSTGSTLKTIGYVTLATGGASLIGGTVTMLMRNNRRSDLESECGTLDGTCAPDAFDGDGDKVLSEQEAVEDLSLWSNVLLFGGGAVAATGLGLLLLSSSDSSSPKDEAGRNRPQVALSLSPQGAAVGVSGSF